MSRSYYVYYRSAADPAALRAAVVAMQADECLVAILLCGALERHPGLKVVMAESHIGWIPYVLERLEMKYKEGMYDDLISTKPSELIWMASAVAIAAVKASAIPARSINSPNTRKNAAKPNSPSNNPRSTCTADAAPDR